MKVALVHDWLNGMRGGEKVLEIFCDLFGDAPIYTLFYEPKCVSEKIRRHKIIPSILQKFPLTRRFYRHYLPLFPWAVRRFDLSGYGLVISTSHCAAKGVHIPKGATHVSYCHTPMRYIWDKFDIYFGQKSQISPVRIAAGLLRHRLRRWDVASAHSVDFFIANSLYIAQKINKYYGRESTVIHPPVDTGFFCPGSINKERDSGLVDYYLIVSALVPYKRIDVAVDAFRGRSENLVIAGSGPEERRLCKRAPANVKFLGWQSDVDLRNLYRGCRALIFTAEEDFGIVPLEATACGRPVIAYAAGGALETVVEGKTGVFFHQQTPESLSMALDNFRPDGFDAAELHRHAERFSPEVCLEQLKAFLKEKVGVIC